MLVYNINFYVGDRFFNWCMVICNIFFFVFEICSVNGGFSRFVNIFNMVVFKD